MRLLWGLVLLSGCAASAKPASDFAVAPNARSPTGTRDGGPGAARPARGSAASVTTDAAEREPENVEAATPEVPASPASPVGSASPVAEADPENRSLPATSSAELGERARHLFDAVTSGNADGALDFFFPREPFIPLKDVADPRRYHDELVRSYRHDVATLHGARRSWEGATFVGFEIGTPPKWVAPGHEWNKIGYFRTFDSRLTYEVAGKRRTIIVRTIISWNGRWFVTHLLPLHRKP